VLLRFDNPQRSIAYLDAALTIGTTLTDRCLIAYVTFDRGLVACFGGDVRTGLEAMRQGIELIDEVSVTDIENAGSLFTTLFADSVDLSPKLFEEIAAFNLCLGPVGKARAIPEYRRS
jgi:hypothetical protein